MNFDSILNRLGFGKDKEEKNKRDALKQFSEERKRAVQR